jgi:hypothetical protein
MSPTSVCAIAAGRITSLEILKLDNITETMVWVDFLSTTEINVAILCVSLPMLGPFIARYATHHGASKLGRSPDENQYYQQSGSKQTSSRFSKKKPNPDTIGLDSIYAHNMETQHDTTVSAAKDPAEVSSLHDSESSLNPGPRLSGSQGQGGTIIVHKKWEISSS